MEIEITDNLRRQIVIGREIKRKNPSIYKESTINELFDMIYTFLSKKDYKYSMEELLYISIYNYWLYGFTVDEFFYLRLLNRSHIEKLEYISHMDRMNYMKYLNRDEDVYLLANKYQTYIKLHRYYGREIIFIDHNLNKNVFLDFFERHNEFVIKPVGLAISIGVRKASKEEYENNGEKAYESILYEINNISSRHRWATGKGVIIEEVITQGKSLAKLHEKSINSIRLTTVNIENRIQVFHPVLRIGMNNNFLCCGAVGSILSGINEFSGCTETEGHNERAETYRIHPNTKIPIKGIQIPKWNDLCEMAKELAGFFPTIGYIGWDFVYNEKDEWIVMEANENGEFLQQIAYQKGFYKEFISLINWKSKKKYWWLDKYDIQ